MRFHWGTVGSFTRWARTQHGSAEQREIQGGPRTKWGRAGKSVSPVFDPRSSSRRYMTFWSAVRYKRNRWAHGDVAIVSQPGTMDPPCPRSSGWSAASSPMRWTPASASSGWRTRGRKQAGWSICTLWVYSVWCLCCMKLMREGGNEFDIFIFSFYSYVFLYL